MSFADEVNEDEVNGDEVNEDEERAFRLRVARLARATPRYIDPPPRRDQTASDDERVRPRVWPGGLFQGRERCVSEDVEARERSRERRRRERVWEDDVGIEAEAESEAVRWVRWRRVKRTRTEEWRPLAGWRRV